MSPMEMLQNKAYNQALNIGNTLIRRIKEILETPQFQIIIFLTSIFE